MGTDCVCDWADSCCVVSFHHDLISQGVDGLWTQRDGIKLQGLTHSKRQSDYLDMNFALVLKANTDKSMTEVRKDLWGNPSQSVQRLKSSGHGGFPCLTRSALPYSYEFDWRLSGAGCLQVQGAPSSQRLGTLKDSHFLALAGEGSTAPVVGCCILSMW